VIDLEQPHLTPRHDLVSHLAYAAAAADVRHTVCDGRVLMRDREVLTLEETAVRASARGRRVAFGPRRRVIAGLEPFDPDWSNTEINSQNGA